MHGCVSVCVCKCVCVDIGIYMPLTIPGTRSPVRLTNLLALGIILSQPPQSKFYRRASMASFYVVATDQNSGPDVQQALCHEPVFSLPGCGSPRLRAMS